MPKPPKAIVVWLAQAFWLYVFAVAGYALVTSINAWSAFMAVVASSLIAGMQLRMRAAAWVTGALFTLSIVLTSWESFHRLLADTGSAERSGELVGQLLGSALMLALPYRLLFGEPARAYFAGKPVRPPPSFEGS